MSQHFDDEAYFEISMPLLGDEFPELKVQTTHGPMNIPGDLKGSWFVLFSHPADYAPVCTTEFVAFQQRAEEFEKLGCKLIGMSVDQVFSHIKWVERIKDNLDVEIEFPVVAANWPDNDLIGDRVIVPPAKTVTHTRFLTEAGVSFEITETAPHLPVS